MRTIIAHYRVSSEFQVPKSIPLLSVEDNEGNVLGKKTPWSWWIKYDTLYYYDANCNVCEISPTCPAYESSDYKYPYEEEEGSDSEDEVDDDEDKAARWAKQQREDYKNNKLSQEKIDILNKTPGWTWDD